MLRAQRVSLCRTQVVDPDDHARRADRIAIDVVRQRDLVAFAARRSGALAGSRAEVILRQRRRARDPAAAVAARATAHAVAGAKGVAGAVSVWERCVSIRAESERVEWGDDVGGQIGSTD